MAGTLRSLLLAAALLLAAPAASAEPAAPVVVVELFTSQGCDSCPPADAFLGELAARDDVLPLGFHVTYWDRLGWKDTFGAEAYTQRQRAYAWQHGESRVYTPQMIIGGAVDAAGSDRRRVLKAIELFRERFPPVALTIEGTGREARLRLPAAVDGADGGATVWLAGFDRARDVAIARGENAGRTIRYHNVVLDFEKLGVWTGEPLELPLPLARLAAAGRDGAAVLVQRGRDGVIVGGAALALPPAATD